MMTRHIRPIVLLSALALATRLAFLLMFGGLDNRIYDSMQDQYTYLDLAHNLAADHGFVVSKDTWLADAGEPTSILPPLYPIFLALSFRLFSDSLILIRTLQLLLAVVMVTAIYYTASRIFSRRVAVIAGSLTAVYPPLVMYVRPIMSEAIFLPLLATLIAITARLATGTGRPSIAVSGLWGLVAGLAILTRTEVILLVGFLLAYHVYRQLRRPRRELVIALSVPLMTIALTLLPYSLYNRAEHGVFSPLPNAKWKLWDHTWWAEMRKYPEWQGVVLPERQIVPNWAQKSERERDAYLWDLGAQFVMDHPATYLRQRLRQLSRAYPLLPLEALPSVVAINATVTRPDGYLYSSTSLDDNVYYITFAERIRVWTFRIVALLGAAGMILALRAGRRSVTWLLIVFAWNALHSTIFVGSERLRLQIDALLLLLTAYCLYRLWLHLASTNVAYGKLRSLRRSNAPAGGD